MLFRLYHLHVFLAFSCLLVSPGSASVHLGMSGAESAGPSNRPPNNVTSGRENPSGHVPLDVEGYPVAPPGLELEQVHIYIRHGERTPVAVRMADPPASMPEHWMFCHHAHTFRTAMTNGRPIVPGVSGEDESLRTLRVVERADGTASPGECLLGELTDIGRQSTYDFGQALRQLYIDRLGFISDVARSNDEVYLRSTNVPRTIESLEQIARGLYPEEKTGKEFSPFLRIRNSKEENLFGNALACKRLEVLQIGFAKAAAVEWNESLSILDEKVSKYIGGNPIRLDGKPRASGILDTINSANAHGVNIPPEFKDVEVIGLIEKAVVHEWFAGYQTEEVRRLGMGPLLSDLSQKMQNKADKGPKDPVKLLIHSTHDTSLAALCNTLDVFDQHWPGFSSAVSFELFRRKGKQQEPASIWQTVLAPFQCRSDIPSEHYVRMRYQNRDLTLPICAHKGKHLPGAPEFCTLGAFRERVRELTPVNWEEECAPTGQSSRP
ncbi:phosphoglycerate mutase-like protein [Laetiporus sulphureus 93-53]|uniref:Phosphoglycerate mutase-like protein n=1 Tax=Laetiporus sulphureus 93-53 TaxID=1314785 RepID=A0A165GEX8_9APHY|nr:phosphoglycerate mutase-like protein [Laetiporus sulphureus 93-53]KZT10258.1 phosphoglycerate mutase-like protein [Laetiporus sulphureus 93-53]